MDVVFDHTKSFGRAKPIFQRPGGSQHVHRSIRRRNAMGLVLCHERHTAQGQIIEIDRVRVVERRAFCVVRSVMTYRKKIGIFI